MRHRFAVIVTLFFASAMSAQTGKQALIEELLALTQQPQSGFDYVYLMHQVSPADTQEQARVRGAMRKVTIETYAAELSEDDLRKVIAFLQTPAGKHYAAAAAKLGTDRLQAVESDLAPKVSAADAARNSTIQTMQTIDAAILTYGTDQNVYPSASDLDSLLKTLEPRYLNPKTARADAWGTPFVYGGGSNSYALISAGPDRKIDKRSLKARTSADANDSDDIIMVTGGNFIQNGPPSTGY